MTNPTTSDDGLELLDAIEIGIELSEYPHTDQSESEEETASVD